MCTHLEQFPPHVVLTVRNNLADTIQEPKPWKIESQRHLVTVQCYKLGWLDKPLHFWKRGGRKEVGSFICRHNHTWEAELGFSTYAQQLPAPQTQVSPGALQARDPADLGMACPAAPAHPSLAPLRLGNGRVGTGFFHCLLTGSASPSPGSLQLQCSAARSHAKSITGRSKLSRRSG